jgi:hypothetical protein
MKYMMKDRIIATIGSVFLWIEGYYMYLIGSKHYYANDDD